MEEDCFTKRFDWFIVPVAALNFVEGLLHVGKECIGLIVRDVNGHYNWRVDQSILVASTEATLKELPLED